MRPICSLSTTPSCAPTSRIRCRRVSASNETVRWCASSTWGAAGASRTATSDGIHGAELDELIARQVRVFADRGEEFEWKLHGHDRAHGPARAADRPGLRARGEGDGRDRAGRWGRGRGHPARQRLVARGEPASRSRPDRSPRRSDLARRPGRLARRQPRGRTRGRPSLDHDRGRRVGGRVRLCGMGALPDRERTSRRSGVEARSQVGAVAASTGRSSPTAPTSPRSEGPATCRWTRRRRVGRSSSDWVSSPSRRRPRSSGRRRRGLSSA